MTHFTDTELGRWREDGPGGDRNRVIAHVAACASCAARYAEAIRTRPLAETPAEPPDAIERFTGAGRQIVTASPRGRRIAWVVLPLAAAAAIALMVMLPGEDRPQSTPPVLRGSGVQALVPEGTVDTAARFEWSSGMAAPRYRIEISEAGKVIGSFEAATSPAAAPDEWRTRLQRGVQYSWTVTAVDADGRPIATSPPRTFTVSR